MCCQQVKNTYRPFLSSDVTRPHNWNDDDSSRDDDGSTQLNHPPALTHSHSLHHSHNDNNIFSSLGAGVETKTIFSAKIRKFCFRKCSWRTFLQNFREKILLNNKKVLRKSSWRTLLQNFREKIMFNCKKILGKFSRKNSVALQKNSTEKSIFVSTY